METPKDKKDSTKEKATPKKSVSKSTKPSSLNSSVKSKAKSEVQKKAASSNKNKTPSTSKNTNRKPRISNSATNTTTKPKQKNVETQVPPRRDVRGIPSAKLDVFKKGSTFNVPSKENNKRVGNHEYWKQAELDLEKKEKEKAKTTPNKKESDKTAHIHKKESIKVPLSTQKKDKAVDETKKKSPQKKTSPKKTTKKKTQSKKNAKKKKSSKKKKKALIKKKRIIFFSILSMVIILLTFLGYKMLKDTNFIDKIFSNDDQLVLTESTIIAPKQTENVETDYIYVGNNINDLDTLNKKSVDDTVVEDNSIINISDETLSGEYVKLTIDRGLSASAIATLLEENNVCSKELFLDYVIKNNLETNLRSGVYFIKKNSSVEEIVSSIVETDFTTITIYPASTLNQIDQLLTNRNLIKSGEFIQAATTICEKKGLDFVEGWFTPATYKITNQFDVNLLASTMLDNTFKILSPYLLDIAKSGYTINDIIIIASLIQGETQDVSQMPIISSVIHNRLKVDMPLGIDATTRYELGDWTSELSQEILDEITPYNTRRKKGLPPSGICLSSKEALISAIYPIDSDYLYYIHDKEGNLIPALTYEEHLENIEKRDN